MLTLLHRVFHKVDINLKNKKLLFREICIKVFRSQRPYPIVNDLNRPQLYPTIMFSLYKIHFNIIIPSIKRIESGLFPRHLLTKIVYAFLISSTFTTRLTISALKIQSFITLNKNCESFSHSPCNFLPVPRCSSFITPIQHFVPKHLQKLYNSLRMEYVQYPQKRMGTATVLCVLIFRSYCAQERKEFWSQQQNTLLEFNLFLILLRIYFRFFIFLPLKSLI